jgi:hypothetical protein
MIEEKNITTAEDAWLKICTKLWGVYGVQTLVDEAIKESQTFCEVTVVIPAHVRLITNFGHHVLGFHIKRKELNQLNISWGHFGGGA